MAAVLNPVRNVSTHFVQDQLEPRRLPHNVASSSSAAAGTAASSSSQPKNLKRTFRSSLQETIRNVTLARKSREKISQESNDSSEIEKPHTQRLQAPPPSAFNSHFHRPSIFRRSPETSNASNTSVASSSGASTPVARRSTDRQANPHSLTIQTDNLSPPPSSKEQHRPRVLRKQSTRVKTRSSDPVSSAKRSSVPSSVEGVQGLSRPTAQQPGKQQQPGADDIGWSAFVTPTLSKGSMSSPTLLQHMAENAKEDSDQALPSSSKSRSPLLSLSGLFPQARTRKLSTAGPPPAPTIRAPSQKNDDKTSTSGKGEFRKRVSSSLLPSRLLGGTIKDLGGSSQAEPTKPSVAPSAPIKSKQTHSSSSSPPTPSRLVISHPKTLTSDHLTPSPPLIPPKSPSRLLRFQASASTPHLENPEEPGPASSSHSTPKEVKVSKKMDAKEGGRKESSKSNISSRIIGMGHPSTMRKHASASTSNLPSTVDLSLKEQSPEINSRSPSSPKDVSHSQSSQSRRVSEDAPTIRASASTPSMARRASLSPTPDAPAIAASGRLSPRLRATSSTAASRARATSPSPSRNGSLELPRGSGGHLAPRATSPSAMGVKQRRASSSSVTRPSPSPSPTPSALPGSRSSRLGRGVGSVSASHLPLEARGTTPLPLPSPSSSPSPSPILRPARVASGETPRLAPRRGSSSRPSHGHSASVPIIPTSVSAGSKDGESKPRPPKLHLRSDSSSGKIGTSQLQPRSASSTPVPSASPVPDSPSPAMSSRERFVNESSSLTSTPSEGLSPQRAIIRRAAGVLVREVVHRKPSIGSGTKVESSNEEIDSRMRSLVRLERTWSTNMVTANGEERERRVFGDALRDGYVLCSYINKVSPGSVVRVDSSVLTPSAKQLNVSKFLAAAAALGVPSDEIFDVEDLTVGSFTLDGLARVALTILAVKKLQDDPPPKKFSPSSDARQSPISMKPTGPASHGVYSSSNAKSASASTPNLTRSLSPIPTSKKRSQQAMPTGLSTSAPSQTVVDLSSSALEDEEDVFGPVDSMPPVRHNMKLSTTSRTSMASTHTEASAYSSLLDNRSTRYGTIKTITTEATSLASEIPSLTHTEASFVKASLAKESPQLKMRRLGSPNSPVDDAPRRKDRRRSDSIDLSRVAEESEEGTIPTRRLNGNVGQPQKIIKLGQAKWPDDFIKAFDMDRSDPVKPDKKDSEEGDSSGERERGREMVNLDDSLGKHRPLAVRSRRSLDSTESVTPPPPLSRVRPRSSQRLVVAAELSSRVSPRSSFEHSPVRRPVQQPCSRALTDGDLVPTIPFPRTPSVSQLSTLPSSSETLLPPPVKKPRESPSKHRIDNDPPKDRRSSFGDDRHPRIPMRPRHESINVTPVESKGERSLIGGMDGSQVRKTLIVKEDGKPATHYQLGNCIGRGQFGTVYRALNLNTGQTVAVKRIRLEGLNEKEIKQLMHEVEIVKQLSHPSIVKYEGMARDPDILSIVLEYAENGSLAQTLKAFGKLNESLVASFVTKVLEGLHYLHTSQVVHCDLKAANILTTKTGNVKLSDFGVSLNLRAMEQMNNDVAGTPNWMAPEVIELKGASPASDIWSLACTIIELLTGRPPYADIQNGMTVMFRIVEDPMPPLPEDLSDHLKDFLTLCFNKDPTKRPNAETLFEHPWLKNEWGIYKELRPQDSIPFLRRVSADLQRTDIRRLSFVDDERPNSPRSNPSSPISHEEMVFRPHEFVKSSFSQAVTCRICNQAVKKSVLFCKECSLIAHAKCAADNPDSCEGHGRVKRPSQDVVRQHTPVGDIRQTPTPTPRERLLSSPSLTQMRDVPPSSPTPTPNDRFRLFGRKSSKASGLLSVSTEDLKGGPLPPPVAFKNGSGKAIQKVTRSPSQENGNSQWRASVGSSDHTASTRSALTRSSHVSESNRGSEYEPIPENPARSKTVDTPRKPAQQQQSSKKSRQEGNSDKCILQ